MKTRRWVYLLTGLGLLHKEKVTYPNIEEVILDNIGVRLRRISLTRKDRIRKPREELGHQDRFVFYVSNGIKDDNFAQKFADAVTGSLALAYDLAPEEAFTSICISEDMIKLGRFIRVKDILGSNALGSEPYFRVVKCTGVPSEVLDYIWHIVPTIVKNQYLMDASNFYRESITQAWVADDNVLDIMSDNSDIPASQADRVRVETAYQNAFKAIEAVIGEPPKDKRKLRIKLLEAGINPDEMVGFDLYGMKPGKEAILKKIADMQHNRDKKVAHGKTDEPRNIGYCELKDKQALAGYLISTHIETKMKQD